MDENLVKLIRAKKDEGLTLLIREYSGLVYYIVRNILEGPEEIEECVNDIYMKVWKSIDSYSREKSKFSTWLTVISRNTALNYLKANRNLGGEIGEDFADKNSTEDKVIRREEASSIKEAISTLTPEEQHIFYRKYYYLQKTVQIAAELGMTERSIEGKLYRMRKKLQKRLGGEFR